MILKASERGGGRQLAAHLMNDRDNEHIEVLEVSGFASANLHDAFEEAFYVSKGTKATNYLFSLSLNPPKDQEVGIEAFHDAAERAGKAVGLEGQPFALVIHEKEGRRHAHVVWSKIDADQMKAINLPFYKDRLRELSKELYLEHGWELPNGHRENGWSNPLNFTLAEWQQAKRLDLDPREIKQLFRDAWETSDSAQSFGAALEDRGFFLAKGDRRPFVALNIHGEVYSVPNMTGVKTKEIEKRLGSPDKLPTVDKARLDIRQRIDRKVHAFLAEARQELRERQRPLLEEHAKMIRDQRIERERLREKQEERRIRENRERQGRLRTGIRGLLDIVIGRAAAIRKNNEREAYDCSIRDREQREQLYMLQKAERRDLQHGIDDLRRKQRKTLMSLGRTVGRSLKGAKSQLTPQPSFSPKPSRERGAERESDFDFGL